MVASSEADATLTHTPKSEWDMAAAGLIVEEAGGIVTTFDGNRLLFNREETKFPTIVAAGSELHPHCLNEPDNFKQMLKDSENKS